MNPFFENIFDSVYKKEEGDLENVISALKQAGANQMESTMLLVKKLRLKLIEADPIVINSLAWKDDKERTEKFRQEFSDYLNSLDKDLD